MILSAVKILIFWHVNSCSWSFRGTCLLHLTVVEFSLCYSGDGANRFLFIIATNLLLATC